MSFMSAGTHLYGVKYWATALGQPYQVFVYQGTDRKKNIHYFKKFGVPYSILTTVHDSVLERGLLQPFVIDCNNKT